MSEYLAYVLAGGMVAFYATLWGYRCGWRAENRRIVSLIRYSADLRGQIDRDDIARYADDMADRIERGQP